MTRKIDLDLNPSFYHFYSGLASASVCIGLILVYTFMSRFSGHHVSWPLFATMYFLSLIFEEISYEHFLSNHRKKDNSYFFHKKYSFSKNYFSYNSVVMLIVEYLMDGALLFLAIKANFSVFLFFLLLVGGKIVGCPLQGCSPSFYSPHRQVLNWLMNLAIFVFGFRSHGLFPNLSISILTGLILFRALFCNFRVLLRGIHCTD